MMVAYTLERLLQGVLTIWFIATATFLVMHSVPGDPLLNEREVPEQVRINLEARYGLDKPLFEQYLIYIGGMLKGDFGVSFTQENRTVNDIISEHFPVSAALGVLAIFWAVLGGVLFGALSALFRGRLPDYLILFGVILCISVPNFVFAAFAQLMIIRLNQWVGFALLPVAGFSGFSHSLVPSLVLGLGSMAFLVRLMRSSMLEVIHSDYVMSAKAKGLSSWRIFRYHQLRNASLPLVTVLGPAIATITTGGFVVETLFSIPGLGRYFVLAVQQLDYTVIMGTTVFYGAFLVIMVLIVDLLYGYIDPRVRLDQ